MEALFLQLVDQIGGLPTVSLIMTVLRYSSKFIGWIARKTENKWDNKLAKFLAQIADAIAWLIGNFGIGSIPGTVKQPKVPEKIKNKLTFKR
jgi:hypothetical protein